MKKPLVHLFLTTLAITAFQLISAGAPGQCSPVNDPTASCFNAGTFYIFGTFTNRQCQ